MTHNCRKLKKYLFPGFSGCIFDPATGGPGESSCPEGSEYVWQRGVGSQKCPALRTLHWLLPATTDIFPSMPIMMPTLGTRWLVSICVGATNTNMIIAVVGV